MQFSKEYFEDEVREGFYVSGMMKRVWAAQLEVLEEVAKVCEKHKIRWFADCGTLLGAVRHNGYIPWDDDLDICMLRDDYIRFIKIAKQELPSGYWVINFHTEEFWEMLTRVTNGNEVHMQKEHLKKYHDYPFVAGIDIFPLDYVAPTEEEEELRDQMTQVVQNAICALDDETMDEREIQEFLLVVEEICAVKLDRKRPIKLQLYILLEKLYSLFQAEESSEVVLMPYWLKDKSHKYPLKFFEQTILLPFEGFQIQAPAAYEGVLKIEYGNYMTCVKGMSEHDYPQYKTQEEMFISRMEGNYPFRYVFSKEHLKNEGRATSTNPKEQIKAFINLLEEAHREVCHLLGKQEYVLAMDLMASCQNVAIQVGTLIEQLGKGTGTVELLEEYCELVYQLHENLIQGEVLLEEEASELLKNILNQIKISVKKEVIRRKEIVFIPYKANHWKSLESIWKAAMEDEDCDVYVIPVSYFVRNVDATVKDVYYEGDKFPEYVKVMDYMEYDMKKRHPDMIFTNNPYDGCNPFFSIDANYYSEILKRYTEQLVYIPPFVLDEISSSDNKGLQTTEYFVKVPGIVHADKVIVQSEKMRQTYIDVLTEFAGEDTKVVWEEKIKGLGSPLFDVSESIGKECMDIPESWKKKLKKKDGSDKKVILYHISLGGFLEYGEQMLSKIESVLNTFKEKKEEITLLFCPHPLILKTCEFTRPQLYSNYQRILDRYLEEDWGIYDDGQDLNRTIGVCDAYYGDSDSVAQQCKRVKKQVMIQNVDV